MQNSPISKKDKQQLPIAIDKQNKNKTKMKAMYIRLKQRKNYVQCKFIHKTKFVDLFFTFKWDLKASGRRSVGHGHEKYASTPT